MPKQYLNQQSHVNSYTNSSNNGFQRTFCCKPAALVTAAPTKIIETSDSFECEQTFDPIEQCNGKVLNEQSGPALRLTVRPSSASPESSNEILTMSLPFSQMSKEHLSFFKQQESVIIHLKPTEAYEPSSTPTQLTLKIRPCESYKVVLSEIHIPLENLSEAQIKFFKQPATITLRPTQQLLDYNLDSKPSSKADLLTKEEKEARILGVLENGNDSDLQDSELSSSDVGPFSVINLANDFKKTQAIAPLDLNQQKPKALNVMQPHALKTRPDTDLDFTQSKKRNALAPMKFSSKISNRIM